MGAFMPFCHPKLYQYLCGVNSKQHKGMKTKSKYCAKRNILIQQKFDELYKKQNMSMIEIYVIIGEEYELSTDRVSEIIHKRRIWYFFNRRRYFTDFVRKVCITFAASFIKEGRKYLLFNAKVECDSHVQWVATRIRDRAQNFQNNE